MAASGHALLSASKAHQWLACTPSARLEENLPDIVSDAAKEGTLAHAIVEEKLQRVLKGKAPGKASAKNAKNALYTRAMEDYTDEYVSFVLGLMEKAKETCSDPILLSEQKVDFSGWVPEGFGTTDTTIIADGVLTVVDFKYGKGTEVRAEGNPQLRLYALGAYDEYSMLYDIDTVRMYIVQPRCGGVSMDEMSADDLLKWAEETVAPKAQAAIKGEGKEVIGDHCKFCKAKIICQAKNADMIEMLKYECRTPAILSTSELANILPKAEALAGWAKAIKEWLRAKAISGDMIPGYKLVEGRSDRQIKDTEAFTNELLSKGYKPEDILTLKGIGDLEDVLGKKVMEAYNGTFVVKPPAKPTLVPDSDPRPVFEDGKNMFND